MFVFNNGDPFMFNRARPLLKILKQARERRALRGQNKYGTYRMIARTPIAIVSKVQRELFQKAKVRVGGKIHDLVITPSGQFLRDGRTI